MVNYGCEMVKQGCSVPTVAKVVVCDRTIVSLVLDEFREVLKGRWEDRRTMAPVTDPAVAKEYVYLG